MLYKCVFVCVLSLEDTQQNHENLYLTDLVFSFPSPGAPTSSSSVLLGFHVGVFTLRDIKDLDFYPYLLVFFFNYLYKASGKGFVHYEL